MGVPKKKKKTREPFLDCCLSLQKAHFLTKHNKNKDEAPDAFFLFRCAPFLFFSALTKNLSLSPFLFLLASSFLSDSYLWAARRRLRLSSFFCEISHRIADVSVGDNRSDARGSVRRKRYKWNTVHITKKSPFTRKSE